jgi:DNA-binding transcriptional MerR regulator
MTATDLISKKLKKVAMEKTLSPNQESKIVEQLKQKKGEKLKYRDVHEILKQYDKDYTKRQLTYYIEKGLIPEPEKTAPNQAEYSTEHIIYFLIIDNMKNYVDRDDIKNHLDLIIESKDYLNLDELIKVYLDLDHVNQLISSLFNKNNFFDIKFNNLDSIIVDGIEPDKKETLTKVIMSLFYFTSARYFTDLFLKET